MDAGVQLVSDIVIVLTAENPATPSKVAAVVAGAAVSLPVPLQVPETVPVFVYPFATSVLYAVCSGKDNVEATGPEGAVTPLPPLPPPHAVNSADAISVGGVRDFV